MEFGNQQIEPQHLLEGIFQVDENISPFLLKKSEADAALVRETQPRKFRKTSKSTGRQYLPFTIGKQSFVGCSQHR